MALNRLIALDDEAISVRLYVAGKIGGVRITGVDWVSPLGLAARGVDFDIGAVSLDVKARLVLKEVRPAPCRHCPPYI